MKNPKDDLQHIRLMMERSSRFISLNGLSGVVAGLLALGGAVYAYFQMKKYDIDYFNSHDYPRVFPRELVVNLLVTALVILVLAIGFGIYFTVNKSKKLNLKVWNTATRNVVKHLAVPLVAGGLFCLALMYHNAFVFLAPATLVFYGLALINASKYTFGDVFWLGICEVILGIFSAFFLGFGLVAWAIGFGVLHIVYGMIVYKKYR